MFSRLLEYRFRYYSRKPLLIGLLLLVSFGMRVFGVDWDQGAMYHPDERAIFMKAWDLAFPMGDITSLVDADQSTWNPKWFPYGSYLLYQLKIVAEILNISDFGDLRFIGRTLAALADTATVFVVVMIGQKFFNFATGLVAGMLTAFCVLHIQLSHFYTAEPFFTFFVLCCLWFAYKVAKGGGVWDAAIAGLFFGLAMGTKVSAAPIVGVFGVACVINLFQLREWSAFSVNALRSRATCVLKLMGMFLMAGVVTFLVVSPYALLDLTTFMGDISEQRNMVTRSVDLPYTRQYEDTTRYLYQISQLSIWGFGLPLATLVFSGLGYSCWKLYRKPNAGLAVLLSWVVLYTVLTGWFDVKFLRYMLPVAPAMILLGTYGMFQLAQDLSHVRNRISRSIFVAIMGVTILTAGYAVAYLHIYTQPHPATRASTWINENIPVDSLILSEHWEESIPRIEQYRHQKLPMYEVDNDEKLHQLSFMASTADYILFYSDRLYGTVGRLAERYPISSGFYQKLFDGDLGYTLSHVEYAYPQFLGVGIVNDTFSRPGLPVPEGAMLGSGTILDLKFGYSDESFTVYDHPLILIFANEKRLGMAEIERLIEIESGWLQPDDVLRDTYATTFQDPPAEFSDDQKILYQEGGTWSSLVMDSDRSLVLQVVLWVALVTAIHIAILPLCLVMFSSLPDRGYLLGKTLGILLLCYLVWLLASLNVVTFSSVTIWLTLVVVGGGVWAWALSGSRFSVQMVKRHWKQWFMGETIFLGAFLAFLLIRMMNPDLWHPWRGGEKFMELAYLSATFKSVFMPPYDPWFAGGYINYYYFGYFVIACLAKAIFISPTLSFNLAIPLIFSLVVSSSFSIGYNLAAIGDRSGTAISGGIRRWHVVSGALTALCVAVLANLDGIIQLYERVRHRFFNGGGWSDFDYWRSSRLMPPDPPGHEITEFPYWSLLFGDLHAHVMSIPFCLLVIGILLVIFLRGISLQLSDFVVYGALALSCGALWPLNAWDFPTYVALTLCVFGFIALRDNGFQKIRLLKSAAIPIGVIILSVMLYLPFHVDYKGYGLGLVTSKTQTDLLQYLTIHGLFVFVLVSFLIWRNGYGVGSWMKRYLVMDASIKLPRLKLQRYLFWGDISREHQVGAEFAVPISSRAKETGDGHGDVPPGSLPEALFAIWVKWFFWISSLGILSLFALSGYLVVVLLSVFSVAIGWILIKNAMGTYPSDPQYFALIAVGMALILGIGVDVVTFNNDIGRMNTVFKLYEQAWVLWGIGSGYLMYALLSKWVVPSRSIKRKVTWIIVFSALFASSSVFLLLGTHARLQDRFQPLPITLNGMAYMAVSTYDDPNGPIELHNDLKAIEWMRENIKGSPVILEGRTPMYRWGGRISAYTGLPSIVGWDWHQTQQRKAYGQEINNRSQIVDLIYNTESGERAIELIDYYDVRYVVLGELENLYYQGTGLQKFENLIGNGLDLVYQYPEVAPKVRIYYRAPTE